MKKILPVICGSGDVQAIHTTQVSGTTLGAMVCASSDTYGDCINDCYTNVSDAIKKGYSTVDECVSGCDYSYIL